MIHLLLDAVMVKQATGTWAFHLKSLRGVTSALSACANAVQWEDSILLVKSLATLRLELDAICSNAASSAFKGRRWNLSLAQLSSLETRTILPTTFTHNILLTAGTWHGAVDRLRCLTEGRKRSLRADAVSFSALMNSCQEQSQWRVALQGYNQLHAGGVKMNSITRTASLGLHSAWLTAVQLFSGLRRESLLDSDFMCNNLLKSLDDRWQATLQLLHRLVPWRIAPGTISRSLAMSGCEKSSQWISALQVLQSLRRAPGLRSNEVCYGSNISAVTREQQWKLSLSLLFEMALQGISFSRIGCNAALITRKTAVTDPTADSAPWLYALALASLMLSAKLKPNRVTYNASISACEKSGVWPMATAVLRGMALRGVSADILSFDAAISALNDADAVASGWYMALGHVRQLERCSIIPITITLNAALSACRQRWEAVLALTNGMGRQVEKDSCSLRLFMGTCEVHTSWVTSLHLLSDSEDDSSWWWLLSRSLRTGARPRGSRPRGPRARNPA